MYLIPFTTSIGSILKSCSNFVKEKNQSDFYFYTQCPFISNISIKLLILKVTKSLKFALVSFFSDDQIF